MRTLNFSSFRAKDWWEHKLPPIVAVAYLFSIRYSIPLYEMKFWLLFVLLNLTIGAAYASLINDATDVEEDLLVGKTNRMAHLSPLSRLLVPLVVLLLGLSLFYWIWPDYISISMGIFSYLTFTFYSLPPIRLKNRAVWGTIADTLGSITLPALSMLTFFSGWAGVKMDWWLFFLVLTWSFCYGFRGILLHQFSDIHNDKKAKVDTLALRINPGHVYLVGRAVFALELLAISAIIYRLGSNAVYALLVCYLLLVLLRFYHYQNVPVLIARPKRDLAYQVVMFDFYQTVFPLALLLQATFGRPHDWLFLLLHLLLFPRGVLVIGRDLYHYLRHVTTKLQG